MSEVNINEKGNILKRLLLTRAELSAATLKKTGYNQHLKYNYFELDDFLPKLVELCNKNGIATMFAIKEQFATLKLVNVDDTTDSWEFVMPVATATMQGGQAIQNLGGQITYLRRYLFMTAFEIAETSDIDQSTGNKQDPSIYLTEEEIKEIKAITDPEKLNVHCKALMEKLGPKYRNLVIAEYTNRKEQLGAKI